jgi:hypothetical protein
VGEEGVENGVPDVKEAFDTALDLPADDPDYVAGNPMLGPTPGRTYPASPRRSPTTTSPLLKPTAPGLEVLNGAGQWIDVPTGARHVRGEHRRRARTVDQRRLRRHQPPRPQGREERYSFPLFFNVDYDTEVKPLPRFASAGAGTRPPLRAGEHLFAQTAQSFAYLRSRLDSGELVLPDGSLQLNQFGQQALQGTGR